MRKTRDLFKKIRDTKGTFHAKMGSIKDRNDRDLTEAKILKRGGKNTQKNYTRKIFMTQVTAMVCSLSHVPPLPSWSPWWLLSSTATLPPQDLSPCCSSAVSALCSAVGRLTLSSPQTDMSCPTDTLPSQTLPIPLTSFLFLYNT